MGRLRKGYIRERNGRFEVELAGEFLGTFATRVLAAKRLNTALEEDTGRAPEALALFAGKWIDDREIAARNRKRSRSFAKERSVWRAHVATAKFFDWPIKRLSPRVIQEWIGELSEKKALAPIRGDATRTTNRRVGRRVLENSLKLLKLCLDDAIIAGKMSAPNPARLVKLPRQEVTERDGQLIVHASVREIASLFELELPPMQRAVFSIAIYSGLRLDELWGLRWQDVTVDGKRPELRVRRSYNGPCKTPTSRRDVPLLPPALEALRAWRASHSTTPIAGLVFPRDDGRCHGESYTAGWRDKRRRVGKKLVIDTGWASEAGIRSEVTFHALRHTCGCHLAQGTWTRAFTLHEIKRWLGHSSIAVTERHYAALTSDNLHNAVEDRPFTGSKPGARDDNT